MRGLDVDDKGHRVHRFHKATVHAFMELLGAAGFDEPSDLKPSHIHRRLDFHRSQTYSQLFHYLEPGELLGAEIPREWREAWNAAQSSRFSAS